MEPAIEATTVITAATSMSPVGRNPQSLKEMGRALATDKCFQIEPADLWVDELIDRPTDRPTDRDKKRIFIYFKS
jgi:hypothetical protein